MLNCCSVISQGKEIIEYYLKELEDEGITQVPRWTPSTLSLPPPKPTSPSTNSADSLSLVVVPAISAPLSTDAKDGASQDVKLDITTLQADSLTEILAGTPEGVFLHLNETSTFDGFCYSIKRVFHLTFLCYVFA